MENDKVEQLKERFLSVWNSVVKNQGENDMEEGSRGKVVVFLVAFILALCLWLMVNLSRDYNLNVDLPIVLGNMPSDRALTEELPGFANVSITGEGWQLINIYNNPPKIFVDVTENEINLYDQVRQQINANPDLNVQKVQPLFFNLDMEEKISKKVPIVSNVSITFEDQFDFMDSPVLEPDSITVSGAASILQDIDSWETAEIKIENVDSDISTRVSLKQPQAVVSISPSTVTYRAEVAQYTEGEEKVFVQTRDLPPGRSVSFSPSFITVKYDVPVDEYARIQNLSTPFRAYVPYSQIRSDSTGFVVPNIEKVNSSDLNLKLRSFQPARVSYFMVLEN